MFNFFAILLLAISFLATVIGTIAQVWAETEKRKEDLE